MSVTCVVFRSPLSLSLSLSLSLVNFIFHQVFLKDTDERACAYIAGPAPNRWGFTVDGKGLFESIRSNSTTEGELLSHHMYELVLLLLDLETLLGS